MTTGPARSWTRVPSIGGVQARHASRLALGAFMLLGLLLMHGFGGHAAHAAQTAAHTAAHTAATTLSPPHAEQPCHGGCAEVVAAPAPGQPTPDGGLVALCATVLLALTALLLLGLAGQRRTALLQPPHGTGAGAPPGARADVAPPDLHALSLQRC